MGELTNKKRNEAHFATCAIRVYESSLPQRPLHFLLRVQQLPLWKLQQVHCGHNEVLDIKFLQADINKKIRMSNYISVYTSVLEAYSHWY